MKRYFYLLYFVYCWLVGSILDAFLFFVEREKTENSRIGFRNFFGLGSASLSLNLILFLAIITDRNERYRIC
jgi:hypothetical protein